MIEWCTKHGCRSVSYFYMITMEYYEIKKKIAMRMSKIFWYWGEKKEGSSALQCKKKKKSRK